MAETEVSVQVRCGGAQHTVVVEDGCLVALEHPTPDRERALMALGGDPIPCLELVDRWARHCDDLDVLVLASRGPGDVLPTIGSGRHVSRPGRSTGWVGGGSRGLASAGWSSLSGLGPGGGFRPTGVQFGYSAEPRAQHGAEPLLTLGGGVPRLLVAGIITSWWQRLAERPDDPEVVAALPRLHAATYGRARLAFRDWSGRWDVDVHVVAPDAPGSVSREGERLVVTVPLTWLPDVWLPGLASVAGLFCLSARSDGPGHWRIQGVDRKFETLNVGITVR